MTYPLGNRKHVFLDWDLVEPGYGVGWAHGRAEQEGFPRPDKMPYGVTLSVHPPRPGLPPIVQADRPWESLINVYCTLFEDEGRFRLYYEVHYQDVTDYTHDLKAMLAYAESRDGVHWEKPELGLLSFQGSTRNNLVYGLERALGRGAHGATVFKDPSAPAAERYKLVHMGREADRTPCVYGAVSPDGLEWTALAQPLRANYMSDTQTVMTFDAAKGRYVGYFRGWSGALHTRRTIAYAETDDFRTWPEPRTIVAPDANDFPDSDIYTNGYQAWPGAQDAHLMFPAFYQRGPDTTEVHLCTSRDGVHWFRPQRNPIIPPGEPGTGYEGGVYAGCGLVSLRPGEVSLPVGPKWHTHNQSHYVLGRPAAPPDRGHIALATWRRDGFTSLEARTAGGFSTLPLTFNGRALQLNAWTRFGGLVAVEITDAQGTPLPGLSFAECDRLSGDLADAVVTWQGRRDLGELAGKPVRLNFRLERARLHALQFIA